MERDIILNGVHIGEHSFDPDHVIDEINERCVKPGYNMVTIRTRRDQVPQERFIEWAEYLTGHKIYFNFLYTVQHGPANADSQFTPETVAKMKEIAGEYFLGDMIGETGSSGACKAAGYFVSATGKREDSTGIRTDYADMKAAHDGYLETVRKYIDIDRRLGMPDILSVEATALNKYNWEAGVTLPMLELMCGNPDILVSNLRGTARAAHSRLWGTYVAHEWYGGMRHSDTLKRKRLDLAYKYAYMAGTNALCLESGDELITAYAQRHEVDSDICQDYRDVLTKTMNLINSDSRPKGGPKVKVAFVSGLHDAWGGWGGSSVWNQFHRSEWGHHEAEHSWRLLDEIGARRQWTDIANYGETDLSALPAYGMYDIVPIEADADVLSRYDYLIFLGWNSMTDEAMEKLTEYVKRGGHLLMTAAHLNYSAKREGERILPADEKLAALFGARPTGEIVHTNDGVKFSDCSLDERILYPGTSNRVCDPIYAGGYADYMRFVPEGGTEVAVITDSFGSAPSDLPAVIENKLGNGVATLVTSVNYPGHPALYPMYRAMVREFVTASARNCEIQILGSDRLRWSFYEGDKLYLLNTDYDLPITVKVIFKGHEQLISLDSLELKALQL